MAIPEQFIDELVARTDIADVVGSYVHLTPKGGSLWGCCPFHNEKTPSFHVVPDRQIYKCFGCGKGGGVISFIMEMENLPFVDVVRLLAKRAGMEVPEAGENEAFRQKRARLLALCKDAARFYHSCLKEPWGAQVRDYIAQRRISPRFATRFGLGAAPDQWDPLIKTMTAKGYTKMELIDAGLAVGGKNGGIYDKFRGRLMLPVIDVRGDVVGFTSRILPGLEGAKYLNSPETLLFKKSRLIYALNYAKNTKRPNLILVEGNIDVITLHQAGFDNVVATMGTALTEEHARILARYTKELVLCYDNDAAGKQSTDRVLNILKNADLSVRVLQLPNAFDDQGKPIKQDPDDFIKKFGAAAFEKCLSGSAEQNDYRLDSLRTRHDLSTEEGRLAYLKDAVAAVAALQSPIERELYGNKAASAAGISGQAMAQEVARYRKDKTLRAKKAQERKNLTPAAQLQPKARELRYENIRSARAEEGIIRLALLEPPLLDQLVDLGPESFSSPLLAKLFVLLRQRHSQGLSLQPGALSAALSPEEMSHLAGILEEPQSMANSGQALRDYLTIIRTEAAKRGGTGQDPLLAVRDKLREKKSYGGQPHE
ncbi:DNA primase [Pseudoflavonifractor phocaeensis]|uniref:DNA primase n=1 Tax=Pseudoflavonifractor phocaeensis TaxID=1870988 RepID=UPI00195E5AFC|nr:DNA primase [Pseudoflavonifractor phocaeensis]MBM6925370.1 DNA primase [Pseudoflavonifractor phocaeensis]